MKKSVIFTLSLIMLAQIYGEPIHDAVKRKDLKKLKQLIETEKADIESKNKWGETPLDVAISSLNDASPSFRGALYIPIIGYLLKEGANPNARSKDGSTPLSIIINNMTDPGNDIRLKLFMTAIYNLLKYGANPKLEDDTGQSAIKLAKRYSKPSDCKLYMKDFKALNKYQGSLYNFLMDMIDKTTKKDQVKQDITERIGSFQNLEERKLIKPRTKIKINGKKIPVYIPFEQ